MDLCNKKDITRGLEGKYSIYHSCAVGLVRGKAGLKEFTDDAVNDPIVKRVRERVTAIADTSITEDQADIEVELQDGRKLTRFIEQSLGNVHLPLNGSSTRGQTARSVRSRAFAVAGGPSDRTLLEDRQTRRCRTNSSRRRYRHEPWSFADFASSAPSSPWPLAPARPTGLKSPKFAFRGALAAWDSFRS